MKARDFIGSLLGIYDVIDDICDEYDIDLDEDEVYDAFNCHGHIGRDNASDVGREIILTLYGKIKEKYSGALDEEKFDYDVSSAGFPCLYYDEEEIRSKEQLERIVELKYSE